MGIVSNHSLSIVSKDASTNTAQVRYIVTCTTSGESHNDYSQTGSFTIDGVEYASSYILPYDTTVTVFDRTVTISNASNRDVPATYYFYTTPYHGWQKGNTSVYIDLPLKPTSNQSVREKTINTITIDWSSDSLINHVWYSLDGGEHWHNTSPDPIEPFAYSGTYTISTDLNPNTTYNIVTRVNRESNNLQTDSSVLNVSTYDIAKFTNVPNVNIGSSHTLTWSNPSGATTNIKLYKTDGSTLVQDFGEVSGTSATLTPTANNIYNLIPNDNNIRLRYYIYTTANGVTYGSYSECTFYVVNSNPIFSDFDFEDNNSTIVDLTGNSNKFVKGYSKVTATVSVANKAIAQNNASMSKYTLGLISTNYSSNTSVDIVSNTPITNNSIIVYAVDSRENSTRVEKIISSSNYLEYENISIMNVSAERNLGGVGTEVTLIYSGYIWNNNFGTTNNSVKSIKYYYKRYGTAQWTTGTTTLSPTLSGNSFSQTIQINGDLGALGFSKDNSYEIKIEISDELSSYAYQLILGSGKPLLAFADDGIAIGAPYDSTLGGLLQIGGDVATTRADLTPDYIVATTAYNQTASSGYAVPLDTVVSYKGSKLTLSNNKITIGTGISKIKISGSIFVQNWSGGGNYLWGIITKNSNGVSGSIETSAGSYISSAIVPQVINVQSGDTIGLTADSPSGGTIRGGSDNTWLYIEVIQ